MSSIEATTLFAGYNQHQIHIKRFKQEGIDGTPVIMIHGSIEDGRIFYSKNGKGLAPFLAKNGFDVFVPDMVGRGKSKPKSGRRLAHSQFKAITEEIPSIIDFILNTTGKQKLSAVAHSWGGVLLMAYCARLTPSPIQSMVFLGTKRNIKTRSLARFFMVDLVWTAIGEVLTALYGYLPAKKWKIGSSDEPAEMYRQTRKWVYSDKWIDQDGFDYDNFLKNNAMAPTLFLAGASDHVLGNQKDVARLKNVAKDGKHLILLMSEDNGFAKDYDHINMCTSKNGPDDHFPVIAQWLNGKISDIWEKFSKIAM